jgi:hypothetical protein
LAQTFRVFNQTYNIGKIYVYLYRARGGNTGYNIRLSIYDCNDDGSPKDELFLSSIHASEVIKDDWYPFEFDLSEEITPDNGYLAVALRHNGDDDNFVLWAYDEKNPDADTIAWTSNNASDWDEFDNSIFAMRIVDNFDPFDESDNTLVTPPTGGPLVIDDPVIDGEIEYSDAILSFVVDSSGSMGMLDRCNNRQTIVNCLVDKFKTSYPSDIKFDVFTFGGSDVDVLSFSTGLGTFATINLDLGTPDRTTYIFSVENAQADIGAVYEQAGKEYSVQFSLTTDQLTLITFGDQDPIDSGTLVLSSGTGDPEISYGSFSKVTIDDGMIAYGFRNLENGHLYNVGEFKVDFEVISDVNLENWQLFKPGSETASIVLDNNGPLDSETIDISASTNSVARKLFTNAEITESEVVGPVYTGDTTVTVVDSTGFLVGGFIDIVQGDSSNMAREITFINGNTITFTPSATLPINPGEGGFGSLVQTSVFDKTLLIDGSTANLLVRDQAVTRKVVFYLQNFQGYFMEWDFKAFQEWISYNIFFFGETARLPMSFFEKDGTPFPNGTQVDLTVDMKPDIFSANEVEAQEVTRTSFAGQNRVYVASTEGYVRGQVIDILDKDGNIQTTEIEEVGEDEFGPYIEIAEPLLFDVSSELGTTIRVNTTTEEKKTPTNNLLATEVPVVDVTPIVKGSYRYANS